MSHNRITLPVFFTVFLVLSGCKSDRSLVPLRTVVDEVTLFTSTGAAGELTANAKMLSAEEMERIFESANRDSKDSLLRSNYCFGLLTLKNTGPHEHTVTVTNHGLAASSEVLPIISNQIDFWYNFLLLRTQHYRASSNGVTDRDKATLKSFAVFCDGKKNRIIVPPYGKAIRLVPLTHKKQSVKYQIKMAVAREGSGEFFHVRLPI